MGFQFLIKLCCQGKRKGGRAKDQIELQGSNWVQGRCWRDKDVSFGSRCTGLMRRHRNSCLTLNWCIVYAPCEAVTYQRAESCELNVAAHQLTTGLTPWERGAAHKLHHRLLLNTEWNPRNLAKHRMVHEPERGPNSNTIVLLAQEVMAKNKLTSPARSILTSFIISCCF